MKKTCNRCNNQKELADFGNLRRSKDGLNYWCKSCMRDDRIKYLKNNKEKYNEYYRKRRASDPIFKLSQNLRNLTYQAFIKNGWSKNTKTANILGAEYKFTKTYIESMFVDGMNWGNYGEWHIDHIKPLSSARCKEELIKLCHYTNLQPLWASDNLSKGSKYEG